MTVGLPWVDADRVLSTGFAAAVDALEAALADGLDPAEDPARISVPLAHGEFLLMPSQGPGVAGVKLLTVAPGNPERDLPRVQAVYLLCDAETLTPRALLDGSALTTLRTPALSAVAARHLAPSEPARVVVFGSGPQAWGHVHALAAVRELAEVVVAGRSAARAEELAVRLRTEGFAARAGSGNAVADATIVVCATTASEPVFDGALVRDDAFVVAVGSHERDRRELDGELVGRSQVVVEDVATALREAGDIVMAIDEGQTDAAALEPLAEIVRGAASVDQNRPRVFKSVGMGWEDLVVAAACVTAAG
ncbi:ornithine cyclodeaminase family protein [Agromyces sp. Marseille-P2726]|uniref:ornithine cyclodeaminase family protein n=1 Tax=Agromyces sp. Marseille-P2726 TaxID=2709132 RepID=UPI00156FBD75|nr:ornithine cyclodeaminase family protein [Agromyces sp. Marseille-P2726]